MCPSEWSSVFRCIATAAVSKPSCVITRIAVTAVGATATVINTSSSRYYHPVGDSPPKRSLEQHLQPTATTAKQAYPIDSLRTAAAATPAANQCPPHLHTANTHQYHYHPCGRRSRRRHRASTRSRRCFLRLRRRLTASLSPRASSSSSNSTAPMPLLWWLSARCALVSGP